MKKWGIILGIIACSLLFFISGALVGFLTNEKITTEYNNSHNEGKKPPRKPSEVLNPILGKIIDKQAKTLKSKTRIPTPSAITKAKGYLQKLQ